MQTRASLAGVGAELGNYPRLSFNIILMPQVNVGMVVLVVGEIAFMATTDHLSCSNKL